MATAYTVPIKSKLPKHLTARVVVMREDGGELAPEDIAAAEALYPPPPGAPAVQLGPKKRAPKKG